MKTIKKAAFPVLLVLECIALYFWQHAVASLTYLPLNGVVPLSILTPALPVLTFLTTFVLLKQSKTPRPVLRALLSTAAMLAVILVSAVFLLSYLTYRFAAPLPVLQLPDWPTGIGVMIVTAVCAVFLTALLICRFIKRKTPAKRAIPAAVGWLLLNACLFVITT